MALHIVRINDQSGNSRYVITDAPGGTYEARQQADDRLRPGEYSDITFPASPEGLSRFRQADPNFLREFGADASIDAIVTKIRGYSMVSTDEGAADKNPPWDFGGIDPKLDVLDPVAGFLKGLGFDFTQGASAARDFMSGMGRVGEGTFRGQQAVDWFRDNIPGDVQSMQGFAQTLRGGGGLGRGMAQIGPNALQNLGYLSSLGNKFVAKGDELRQFANPYSDLEVDRGNISAMLTGAQQGAGISPLYSRGIGQNQVADMFTQFAGLNPGLGAENLQDQNFLKYAADQLGLSRFFGETPMGWNTRTTSI